MCARSRVEQVYALFLLFLLLLLLLLFFHFTGALSPSFFSISFSLSLSFSLSIYARLSFSPLEKSGARKGHSTRATGRFSPRARISKYARGPSESRLRDKYTTAKRRLVSRSDFRQIKKRFHVLSD